MPTFISESWQTICDGFYKTFIKDDRWKLFTDGLLTTLELTIISLFIGIFIGIIVAIIRSYHDSKSGKKPFFLKLANRICKIYLIIIRGTPVMVQLLIMNFVIMKPSLNNLIWCGCLTFGINSGAYVAEIVRSGIMSIDKGQMEAGRSLGLTYAKTMIHIIIPQAIKNILPALGNEFIALIKETSVVTVIGLQDLTKAAQIVQSRTYNALIPYIAIALIYLILIYFVTYLLELLERRLAKSDKG